MEFPSELRDYLQFDDVPYFVVSSFSCSSCLVVPGIGFVSAGLSFVTLADRKSNMKEGRRHPFPSEFAPLSREFPCHQAFDAQPTRMVGGQACLKLSCEDFSYAFRVDAVSADASVACLAGLGPCGTREAASADSEIFDVLLDASVVAVALTKRHQTPIAAKEGPDGVLVPVITHEGSRCVSCGFRCRKAKCGRGAEGSEGQALETREEIQVTANTPNRAIQQEIIK